MKRRTFLALLSSAGASAALIPAGCGPGSAFTRAQLENGSVQFSHRRQGFGHPVEITVSLPELRSTQTAPRPLIVRENAEGWFEVVAQAETEVHDDVHTWTWRWTPPGVEPSDAEVNDELITYRAVLLDAADQSVGLMSGPLEVVCVRRGWGA